VRTCTKLLKIKWTVKEEQTMFSWGEQNHERIIFSIILNDNKIESRDNDIIST
jgi:hypothetical protein